MAPFIDMMGWRTKGQIDRHNKVQLDRQTKKLDIFTNSGQHKNTVKWTNVQKTKETSNCIDRKTKSQEPLWWLEF